MINLISLEICRCFIYTQIPQEWLNTTSTVHIRVASVPVRVGDEAVVCVHPYPIDCDQLDVLKDPTNNALYFPVTKEDVQIGHKRFENHIYLLLMRFLFCFQFSSYSN